MCTECSRVMRFVRISSRLSEIGIRLTIHCISRQPNTYIALDRLKKIKSAPPLFCLLNGWFLKCFSVSQRWHRKYALNHLCLCNKFLHTIFYIYFYATMTWCLVPVRNGPEIPISQYSTQNAYNFGNLQITNKNK